MELRRSSHKKEFYGDGTTDIEISAFAQICSDGSLDFGSLTPGTVRILVSNGEAALAPCPGEDNAAIAAIVPPGNVFVIPPTAFLFSRMVVECANTIAANEKVIFNGRG